MSDDPKNPAVAPGAKPGYTVVKQKKSRWWKVRARTTNWCVSPCTGRARWRWCDSSPPETNQDETHGSRGEDHLRLPRCLSSGLTPC